MWLFLNNAFLSIVAIDQRVREPRFADPAERRRHLLVRARVEGDIESVFPKAEVRRTEDRDYLFRAFVSRADVAAALAQAVAKIDYPNFKNSLSHAEAARHDAYSDVWSVMYNYQESARNRLNRHKIDSDR